MRRQPTRDGWTDSEPTDGSLPVALALVAVVPVAMVAAAAPLAAAAVVAGVVLGVSIG